MTMNEHIERRRRLLYIIEEMKQASNKTKKATESAEITNRGPDTKPLTEDPVSESSGGSGPGRLLQRYRA